MEVYTEKTFKVHLALDEDEAKVLKKAMRGTYRLDLKDENEWEKSIRMEFWNALKDIEI